MRDRVTVLAPAKLNLALDVVGILPGGYHALDMTMQAISLYERVVIRRSPYLDLALPGSNVKPGPGNTAIKAALAFFHYTGLLAGADITIYKSVPVRAGMAGGSADAAAVLVGLNELYGARLSMSELCALGVSIGADVPFALMGGTCRVQGLGDLIKALPPMPECWFTVVMPGYGISEAATTLVGQSLGANRIRLLRRFANITVWSGMLIMGVMGALMYMAAPQIIGVMTPVEEIRTLGIEILRIEAFAEPMFAASIVAYGIFVGVGNTFVPSLMNFGSIWGVRLTLAAWLAPTMGLRGVWLAMCIELCFRGVIFLARLWGSNWIYKLRINR